MPVTTLTNKCKLYSNEKYKSQLKNLNYIILHLARTTVLLAIRCNTEL